MTKISKIILLIFLLSLFSPYANALQVPYFDDVPSNAWYYDYAYKLADDGVFDKTKNFLPDEKLNRGEVIKLIVLATNGMKDYESPGVPTFADVAEDSPYYDYIEAAIQKNIVSGYTDADGNLTGYFGPEDSVNRAEATKILVKAFNIPETLSGSSDFPDVRKSDWFYNFVLTAYSQSILDGYDDGNFGPADPITRAQMAKMIVNAESPKLRSTADNLSPSESDSSDKVSEE